MSRLASRALCCILVLAALVRFAALDRVPPGVYPDEALMGVEGLRAVETRDFKVFYPTNNGREGLWVNLVGASVKIFGPTPFALRFWPALLGTITIPGLFLFTRSIRRWASFRSPTSDEGQDSQTDRAADERVALLAAFFLATSFWHIHLSRIGFPAVMVPALLVWSLYLLLESWAAGNHRCRDLCAALGGALFGLGFHSYIAFRFAPIVVVAVFFLEHRKRRSIERPLRDFRRTVLVWLAAAALSASPILVHFARHPEDFWGRASQVSVFSTATPLRDLIAGAVKSALMLNVRGDGNWRHNIGGSAQLLFPVGAAFLLGTFLVLREAARAFRKRRADRSFANRHLRSDLLAAALFSWIAALMAPAALTSEGVPHALRAAGVLPPVMILAAIGAEWLYQKLVVSKRRLALFAIGVAGIGAAEIARYFVVWARDPRTAAAFNRPYTATALYLNDLPADIARFVIVNARGRHVLHVNPDGIPVSLPMPAQTVIYLTLGHPPATYFLPSDLERFYVPKRSAIVAMESDPDLEEFLAKRYPDAERVRDGELTAFLR